MIEKIRRMPLLSEIDSAVLKKYAEQNAIYIRDYNKGITVYNQRDTCNTLDVVLSGSLVAYTLSENGSSTIMFEYKRSSILGANLLFGENGDYPLNIYCQADCSLLHIQKAAAAEFLHNYSFVMQYIKSLSQNSYGMNRPITMHTQKTLRENILDYLKHQSMLHKSSTIILTISKKQLADYLGVQRPSLFRELKKMKEENIIEIDNRHIKLLKE